MAEIRGQTQVVRRRLEENRRSLAEADRQRKEEAKRLADRPTPLPEKLDQLLAPVRSELGIQESRIQELMLQLESLEVRAPVAGTICEIHSWPGQAVQAGDPIVTIADNVGRFVVSYVRPSQQISAAAGMPVAMRPRRQGAKTIPTAVLRVGPQFQAVPAGHLHDPQIPEWGLPVMIELPGELGLKPGEIVDVLFTSRSRSMN
jgi:multidrug resistance efflux pump